MSGRKYGLTFMQWFELNYKSDPYTPAIFSQMVRKTDAYAARKRACVIDAKE